MSRKGLAVFVGVSVIWGSSFLLIKVAVEEAAPLQLVAMRTLGGGAVLVAVLALQRHHLNLTPHFLGAILVLALVGTILPFFLITWAETHIDSGPTSVLNATTPLFTVAIAAAVLDDERIGARGVIGVLLGLGGVFVLAARDVSGLDANLLADLAVVGGSAGYAVAAVMVRILVRDRPAIVLSALQICAAAVICSAVVGVTDDYELSLSFEVWASAAVLAFLGTGVAYVGYYWLIENAGSVRASLVTYLIPVIAVALGAIVLDEAVHWNTVVGGAIIVLGVALGTGSLGAAPVRRAPQMAARPPAGS